MHELLRHVRLLAFDYNGILVPHNGLLAEEAVLRALERAKRLGIKVCIVTSRPLSLLDERLLRLCDAVAAEEGCVLLIEGRREVRKPEGWDEMRERVRSALGRPLMEGEVVIVYPLGKLDELRRLAPEAQATINRDKVVLVPKGADKGVALRRLKQALGVREGVLAMGDGENDLKLFGEADVKVAPANAAEITKRSADIVLDKVDGDAVVELINMIAEAQGTPSPSSDAPQQGSRQSHHHR